MNKNDINEIGKLSLELEYIFRECIIEFVNLNSNEKSENLVKSILAASTMNYFFVVKKFISNCHGKTEKLNLFDICIDSINHSASSFRKQIEEGEE